MAPSTPNWRQALGPNYEPFGKGNVIGFQGAGTRPDLGISSEWAAQAFITGTQADWDSAHLFTLGTSTHGYAALLNEATGRIPPLNNGPPTGPGGNGAGGSYAGLGAPQPGVSLNSGGSCQGYLSGLADTPPSTTAGSFASSLSFRYDPADPTPTIGGVGPAKLTAYAAEVLELCSASNAADLSSSVEWIRLP